MITTIVATVLKKIITNYKTVVKAVLIACVGLLLLCGINLYKTNKKLTTSLEQAQNNIEAYQGLVSSSQQANGVFRLDISQLKESNDSLLRELDSVREKNKIKAKEITTAATQTQVLNVSKSKGVGGLVLPKDTTYKDSIQYNNLTTVYYTIHKDSINIGIDLKNTQYLYIYAKKEYKNKKNFFKRLFTLDFKKVLRYKYTIVNTNDLLKQKDVRIVEQNN